MEQRLAVQRPIAADAAAIFEILTSPERPCRHRRLGHVDVGIW